MSYPWCCQMYTFPCKTMVMHSNEEEIEAKTKQCIIHFLFTKNKIQIVTNS